ncbi:hypothetical protein GCM10023116_03450 [Kistimonas scapharcae]|uniref:Uncharacterized protein n=1 Tax=Kistimonas scapharcae TaxID=1036133 RepID=A0ABP8UYR4_9GAMM
MTDDIEVIKSSLSQAVERDGSSVKVIILADGHGKWILEVEDEYGNSTVWDDTFNTEQEALQEFFKTLDEEGIGALICKPEDRKFVH